MAGAFFQIGGKMKTISIDVESYSGNDLGKCGVYKYVQHPDFDILLFGYAVDGGAVRVIDLASGETLPEEVLAALSDCRFSLISRCRSSASFSFSFMDGIRL